MSAVIRLFWQYTRFDVCAEEWYIICPFAPVGGTICPIFALFQRMSTADSERPTRFIIPACLYTNRDSVFSMVSCSSKLCTMLGTMVSLKSDRSCLFIITKVNCPFSLLLHQSLLMLASNLSLPCI